MSWGWPSAPGGIAPTTVIDTQSMYGCLSVADAAGNASATWPASNRILYQPFRLPTPITIAQLYCYNGTAVSGNVDIGIYMLDGSKIITTSSVAQAGTSALQLFDITDTLIGPGTFYMGITLDNTTGTLFRVALTVLASAQVMGVLEENPGGFGLPSTATFGSISASYIPLIGMTPRTVL